MKNWLISFCSVHEVSKNIQIRKLKRKLYAVVMFSEARCKVHQVNRNTDSSIRTHVNKLKATNLKLMYSVAGENKLYIYLKKNHFD